MTLNDIMTECWAIARETGTNDTNRLWSSTEMKAYINRTYRHIARETRCIRDSETLSICRIDVAPPADYPTLQALALTDQYYAQDLIYYNDPNSWLYQTLVSPYVFPLDPSILDIDEVKWTNKQWRLVKVSVTKWQVNPYWEQVLGLPIEYATDLSNNKLALNYRSNDIDTLRLIVKRLPLTDLVSLTDIPEIRQVYHDYFRYGVLEQMYSKQDSQTLDIPKALDFGTRYRDDIDHIKRQERILDQRLKVNNSMDGFR